MWIATKDLCSSDRLGPRAQRQFRQPTISSRAMYGYIVIQYLTTHSQPYAECCRSPTGGRRVYACPAYGRIEGGSLSGCPCPGRGTISQNPEPVRFHAKLWSPRCSWKKPGPLEFIRDNVLHGRTRDNLHANPGGSTGSRQVGRDWDAKEDAAPVDVDDVMAR